MSQSASNSIVNRLGKLVWTIALLAVIFTVSSPVYAAVQIPDGVATSAVVAAPVEPASDVVPPAAEPVFTVLGLPVTNSMICTWIVAAIILVVVRLSTWNIKEIPTGMQNLIEAMVEGWEGLIGDILDKRVTRWVFPFATTFFIFIVISNLTDLIPGVGSIGVTRTDAAGQSSFTPLFRPPTTDANLTVAMAGIFLI